MSPGLSRVEVLAQLPFRGSCCLRLARIVLLVAIEELWAARMPVGEKCSEAC